ncbi:hypothetical protein RZN22_01940 [Bacillaceae bacterium S4-13-58]
MSPFCSLNGLNGSMNYTDFDLMDGGDPIVPTQFICERCGGEMYQEHYKGGIHGQEYKLSDVL